MDVLIDGLHRYLEAAIFLLFFKDFFIIDFLCYGHASFEKKLISRNIKTP